MAADRGPVRLPAPLMLARPTHVLPDQVGLAHEPKLDGIRARYGEDRLWSRNGRQRHVPAAVRTLGEGVVLDGGLVVLTEHGCDFTAVCRRLHSPGPPDLTYIVFDLLAVGGTDLRARPYRQRRQQLSGLLGAAASRPHTGATGGTCPVRCRRGRV